MRPNLESHVMELFGIADHIDCDDATMLAFERHRID